MGVQRWRSDCAGGVDPDEWAIALMLWGQLVLEGTLLIGRVAPAGGQRAGLRNSAQVDTTILSGQSHFTALGIVDTGAKRNHRSIWQMGGDQDSPPAHRLEADHDNGIDPGRDGLAGALELHIR